MPNLSFIQRRQFLQLASLAIGSGFLATCTAQNPQPSSSNTPVRVDKIQFLLNWQPEAEYGGFYQALATGIYQDYHLDVTIHSINPQTSIPQLLVVGAVDLSMGGSLNALKSVEQGIPIVTIASIFQQEIQILLTHPNSGNDSLEDLKGKPLFIGTDAQWSYWLLLKQKYGFTDDQIRTYDFTTDAFLKDKNSAQQGILTSEPYTIEKQAGFKPIILPLQEAGYNPYAFTIITTQELVERNPDLIHRFVDASIMGWYSYLDNPEPANELIKRDNPEMTDDLIAYGLNKIKEYDVITSGDAKTLGIGAMTDQRWQEFFNSMVAVGVFNPQLDYRQAYTLKFVNKGIAYYQKYRKP